MNIIHVTQTITGTDGTAIAVDPHQLIGVILPANLSSTAMTFKASYEPSGGLVNVYDVGGASAYSITVGASRYVPVDPRVFAGCRSVQFICGSSETSKAITLVLRKVA